MRRILLILTVTALMATTVLASPVSAFAQDPNFQPDLEFWSVGEDLPCLGSGCSKKMVWTCWYYTTKSDGGTTTSDFTDVGSETELREKHAGTGYHCTSTSRGTIGPL